MAGAWKTIKELHRQTTLGAKEGIAFRYFSRPLASFLLYFIRNSRITPNQVTISSLLVAACGALAVMIIMPWWGLVLGGALFMAAHVLDALDGQLARHRKAGSEVGMHFDFFVDELKAYLVYGAVAMRLYLQLSRPDHGFSLLGPLVGLCGPGAVPLLALLGLGGLAIGISCTQFLKLKAWKETFPPGGVQVAPPVPSGVQGEGEDEKASEDDGTQRDDQEKEREDAGALAAPPGPTAAQRFVAIAEKAGKLVIDYPSYIIILCLLDRVDVYFILYTAAVCLYAGRALSGIALKLWCIDPYGGKEKDSSATAAE